MISMPANLGIVAYALVRSDGTTPDLNSGVTVAHTGPGVYRIKLPGDPNLQEPLQEGQSSIPARDLILVTPFASPRVTFNAYDVSDYEKEVTFFDTIPSSMQAPHDAGFYILILRSLLSQPMDANGNYIAPA